MTEAGGAPFPPKRSGEEKCSARVPGNCCRGNCCLGERSTLACEGARQRRQHATMKRQAKATGSSPYHVCAEGDDVLHDRRNVQPDPDLRDKRTSVQHPPTLAT